MEDYKEHKSCRVCGSTDLVQYLDLGKLPLSNNLCSSTLDFPKLYPLAVMFCNKCGLSQLSIVVDPQVLFGHYVYRSSISKGYLDHCRDMAIDLMIDYDINDESFHIDIAGNDGALLSEFKKIFNHKILNIDPAKNLAGIAVSRGVPTLSEFWSYETASKIVNGKGYGRADLITATNVFAHVDDVYDFMKGIKHVLKDTGICILEFPYLIDFIEKNEFDTIYFEHLSYFSIRPLLVLCNTVGLYVNTIEYFPIHGGSLRVYISKRLEHDESISAYLKKELDYKTITPYYEFAAISKATIMTFRQQVHVLASTHKVAAFAASAKGNTLLNCAGIGYPTIKYIVDETPEKIGSYSPGTSIPIVSMLELKDSPPDYLVILSWNFFQEIKEKCIGIGYRGKFIIPIPEFKIVEILQDTTNETVHQAVDT